MRRRELILGAAALGGLATAGCDRLSRAPSFQTFIGSAEGLSFSAQRFLMAGQPLAREFSARDLSPVFRPNGSMAPTEASYQALAANGFVDWRLVVDGLVANPLRLSLAELRALPARTQITRHDCVEGWSAIGKWTGAPLSLLLKAAGLKPNARYAVFHCADRYDGRDPYYESVDLVDAFHPQTILAYALNDQPLPVANGAPVRMRIERQLGYKHAKYVMRIEITDSLAHLGRGKGSFWADRGYEWYAGI